jgi:hypothetical protein
MKKTPFRTERFAWRFEDIRILTKEEAATRPRGPRPLEEIDRGYREKQAALAAEEAAKKNS